MVVGMSVNDISQNAIGNLGWNDIKLTAPVFVGGTIYAEWEVLAKRESACRTGQGLSRCVRLARRLTTVHSS
jgi:itaconyl-CoA hydratase